MMMSSWPSLQQNAFREESDLVAVYWLSIEIVSVLMGLNQRLICQWIPAAEAKKKNGHDHNDQM